jgi:katanin p80 WD40 repeat-containing subunit B1
MDTTMKVWDVRNKTCIQTYTGHEKEVTCVRFSPDGRWVASASKDGQMFIWDLVAGKLLNNIKIGPSFLTSFEFNPAEFLLAGITSNRTIKFWDMENFTCIGTSSAETSAVRALSFNRDGSALCTATSDTFRVLGWDPAVTSKASSLVGWDRVMEIKVDEHNTAVCGSIISNFVSIWAVDIQNALSNKGVVDTQAAANPSVRGGAPAAVRAERKEVARVEDKEVPAAVDSKALAAGKAPEVTWESGHNAKDMAATIGESFDARRRQKEASSGATAVAEAKAVAPTEIESLLPPSNFAARPTTKHAPSEASRAPRTADPVSARADAGAASSHLSVVGSGQSKARATRSSAAVEDVSYESIAQEESRKSEDVFDKVINQEGRTFMALMNQRLSAVTVLRKYWDKGDMDELVNHLLNMQLVAQQDPKLFFAAGDFFNSIELRGHGMSLDICTKLLPIMEGMVNTSLEHLVLSSLKAVGTICEVFGELIRQTRSVLVAGGVDISREDRLRKCNLCHVVLARIKARADGLKLAYKKSRNAKAFDAVDKAVTMLDNVV